MWSTMYCSMVDSTRRRSTNDVCAHTACALRARAAMAFTCIYYIAGPQSDLNTQDAYTLRHKCICP